MIEIEVGQHNMAHIACRKSKLLDLSDRRVLAIELDVIKVDKEGAEAGIRRLNIAQSEAGINENKSLIRFNEQTMADKVRRQPATEAIEERPANRTHTATIEMVNLHKSSVTMPPRSHPKCVSSGLVEKSVN